MRSLPREQIGRAAVWLRAHARWFVYVAAALACTKYLEVRAKLIPKDDEWYMASEGHPYTLLQVRSFLSGKLAILPHPAGAANDYIWGRGGMHNAWGLGVPILATPFHLVGRLFGAPGFPDDLRFLILYFLTAVLLAWSMHALQRRRQGTSNAPEPDALVASVAAAGFVMVFPTFVGMISSRFLVYEQTIATGALWNVCLLAGIFVLLRRCTPGLLVVVCAAAGFSTMIRIPLAVYGVTTLVLAMMIALRARLRPRVLLAGLLAFSAVTALDLAGNKLRFGSPFNPGYVNSISGAFVNRLVRWGLPFSAVPFKVAAKEMFATLFLLDPVSSQIMMGAPPESVRPYTIGERWREYYSPTYDRWVLAVWTLATVFVCWRIFRRKLWRLDRSLSDEVATVVGLWAIPPTIALFVFYARIGQVVTRYATDFYPAFAAAALCVGMALTDAVRRRAPDLTGGVRLAMAGAAALYIGEWHGWAEHLSTPTDRKGILAQIASIDSRAHEIVKAPDHFDCHESRGQPPVYSHLREWGGDCSFSSGMVFAMANSPCVSFTFHPAGATWTPADDASLEGFRAIADFDSLVSCKTVSVDRETKRLTMCDPHPPAFLLDGMRLYCVASLDEKLQPIDRLKLMRIDSAPSCP